MRCDHLSLFNDALQTVPLQSAPTAGPDHNELILQDLHFCAISLRRRALTSETPTGLSGWPVPVSLLVCTAPYLPDIRLQIGLARILLFNKRVCVWWWGGGGV